MSVSEPWPANPVNNVAQVFGARSGPSSQGRFSLSVVKRH
jgi:hypothetical protein